MELIQSIDPFLMQLFIVPLIVIGLGVLTSILTKKVFVAPLITLLLNLLFEIWYFKYYFQINEISYTSWNIIFPIISLVLSWIIVSVLKQEIKQKTTT